MNRLIAVAVALVLSVFLIAPASGSTSGNSESANQGQVKQTPKTAKNWHDREKKRSEVRKKAAATKDQQSKLGN